MRDFTGANRIQALQGSGLINPDLALTDIVSAAQRIPGVGDGGPVSWELINRDFVFKGLAEDLAGEKGQLTADPITKEQINALRESTILNFDMTLGDLLAVSARIPGDSSPFAWELINRDFVLRGLPSLDLAVSMPGR
jgi:hypothetical protein